MHVHLFLLAHVLTVLPGIAANPHIDYAPTHRCRRHNKYGNPQPRSYMLSLDFQAIHAILALQQHTRH